MAERRVTYPVAPGQAQRTTGRAYVARPRPGQTGTMYAPSRGTAVLREGGVQMVWEGRKVMQYINQTMLDGLARLREQAQLYWENEEWTKANHPEMTNTMRDAASFDVAPSGQNRAQFTFSVSTPYAEFEEFGTVHRPGHYPVRKTMDRVAYRAAYHIAKAAKAGAADAGFAPLPPAPPTVPPPSRPMGARPEAPQEVTKPQVATPQQAKQKPRRRPASRPWSPRVGGDVEVPGYREGTWERGQVVAVFGSNTYQVSVEDGTTLLFEGRQMRKPTAR